MDVATTPGLLTRRVAAFRVEEPLHVLNVDASSVGSGLVRAASPYDRSMMSPRQILQYNSLRLKTTKFCVKLTSHSPPPPPLLPVLTLSTGKHQVSEGEFEISQSGGLPYILLARYSKPKIIARTFWRPFYGSYHINMMELLVFHLEPTVSAATHQRYLN